MRIRTSNELSLSFYLTLTLTLDLIFSPVDCFLWTFFDFNLTVDCGPWTSFDFVR